MSRSYRLMSFGVLLVACGLLAGGALAQPVIDPGWDAFIIRHANDGVSGPPEILANNAYSQDAVEFRIFEAGQKAGLGTDLISGVPVSAISTLHVDRLDPTTIPGKEYAPYINIWVTDGNGNYAVIANEPSDAEWAGSRWSVSDWDFLKTKVCKVYETPGAGNGTSWVHAHAGASSLVFADVADLIIEAPSAAYITNPANGVGGGAPRVLGTNVAYGFNWIFGDSAANYISGGGEGFVVANYAVTSSTVHNVTQDTWYATIQAAVNAADSGDTVAVMAGLYEESVTLNKSLNLIGAGSGSTTWRGSSVTDRSLLVTRNNSAPADIHLEITGFYFETENNQSIRVDWSASYVQAFTMNVHGNRFAHVNSRNTGTDFAIYVDGAKQAPRGAEGALRVHNNEFDVVTGGLLFEYCRAVDVLDNSFTVTYEGVTFNSYGNSGEIGEHLVAGNTFAHQVVDWALAVNHWHGTGSYTVLPCEFSNNIVGTNFTYAIIYGVQASQSSVHSQKIFNNSIASGSIMVWGDFANQVTINASGNWWGSDTSPASRVTTDRVDYTPWLAVGTDTSGDPGFQGDFSTLWVTAASLQVGSLGRVQEAVEMVDGSTINILPGLYEEQVWITTNDLTLAGSGSGDNPALDTIIRAPAGTMPNSFMTGSNINRPVVGIVGCTGAAIHDLRVDGFGRGNANYRFQGIGFMNAGGAVSDCAVVNVQDTPFSGSQHGVGVYAYNDDGGPYAIALTNVLVDAFQKTGVALSGEGLTVALDNVTTNGIGATTITAQNGIQVGFGASGTVTNSFINDIAYDGTGWTATGLLIYDGVTVDVDGVQVDGCETSVYWINTSGSFVDGTITNPISDGLFAYSTGAKAENMPRALPLPFDGEVKLNPAKAPVTLLVDGCTVTGNNTPDMWGIGTYALGPISLTVVNSTVNDWDYGIVLYDGGAGITAQIENNAIFDNDSYGLYSNAPQVAQASCNWWGDIGGPNAVGNVNPAGDVVAGNVVYWPWLDAIGGACNQYPGDNVSVGDATACLTPDNACVSVPVILNRIDTTASRGVSVTFQLSPELELCDPTPPSYGFTVATGAGSWLDTFGNYTFQVVDNGSGSYTADLAILGSPCGPTNGGVLFTVPVAAAVANVQTVGTITVTDVLVRDCNNAPLPGVPGAPGTVSIDDLAPAVLADLAAVQQKLLNPAGGTTNINVSWTAPGGDADLIQIWRKGFGFYPEYDDGGGAVPTAPVTLGNGWTLVTTVPAATTSYVDYTTDRDFYYYAAYVVDGCGNVSAVSSLTAGTLNYHLGDVAPATTGDNLVDIVDISLLGSNYGITIAHNDPVNYLDVGPTTDFSVDGRPLTDNRIQFEDLMMFAINFAQVGKADFTPPPAAITNAITLIPGQAGDPGTTFDVEVRLAADGQIQGLSLPLTWDSAVVEPVDLRAGDLLPAQGGQYLVAAPEAGTVDAAIFGVRDRGISGEGSLAFVTFRVKAAGDPRIGLGTIEARDSENQMLQLFGSVSSVTPSALPTVSVLAGAMPNPFNPATELSFSIAREGAVKLSVYTLRGQLVRTLVQEHRAAGHYTVTWNGTDNAGQTVASGSYVVRLEAPDRTQSQRITLVK